MTSSVSRVVGLTLKHLALLVMLVVLSTGFLLATGMKPAAATDTDTYSWPSAPCASSGSNLGQTSGTGYWCSDYNWGESPCPTGDGYCSSANKMNGYYLYDQWGMGFRNCTSYVAEKLSQVFSKNIISSAWGDAADWNAYAIKHGYGDDVNPRVGDVAQWNSPAPWGHVAYVYAVNGSGVASYDEYNYGEDGNFASTYTSASGSQGLPSTFIHIGDPSGGGGGGGYTGVGNTTYTGGNGMADGTTMLTGHYLASNNVQGAMILQSDGNAVLYYGGNVVWKTNTSGSGANRLVMQTDGNLVLYRPDNSVVWSSGSGGHYGTNPYAVLQDDGNFVIYTSSGTPLWQSLSGGHANLTYFGSDRQTGGQDQYQNQYLRSSDNRYALLLETNGNVVLYSAGYHPLWASYTNTGDTLTMQTDGNLVEYAIGNPVWWTGTSGNAGAYAVMQTDGDFVVYTSSNFPLFASNTGGQI